MMGPLLAMTFAMCVRDGKLFTFGLINELKMCLAALAIGATITLISNGNVSVV